MKRHLSYLNYVARHKWFVFLACFKMGVPIWRGVIHDWTKLLPREWFPYTKQFFDADGSPRKIRDTSGAYDPNAQPLEFKYAWLSHQRNKHHWQAWVSLGDGGTLSSLPIPETYLREMIADWIGAGKAQGKNDPRGWYEKNKGNIIMHAESRLRLEQLLEEID